jgi:hypothetical protein
MSRTPARHHQADVARALRAAKQVGAGAVRLLADGTIRIDLQADRDGEKAENEVEYDRAIVL